MKTRTIAGGLIVVALVVGGFLGHLLPKLGFGPGAGPGPGPGGRDPQATARGPSDKSPARPGKNEEEVTPPDARVARVRIDATTYTLAAPAAGAGAGFVPATVDEIVKAAVKATGDERGIRVRVSRRPNSKSSAEIRLRDALVDAGIAEEAIDWQDGPPP